MYTGNSKWVENDEGVHLYHLEHTLCGIACDAFDSGDNDSELIATKKRRVTCSICAEIVDLCRGVEVRRK